MTTFSAEDRALIRDSFARLLLEKASEADLRLSIASDTGFDTHLWSAISEMGIPGLLVDPEYGGVGGTAADLEAIMEEAGSALLCAPLLSTAVLAAGLLGNCTDVSARKRLLPGIASGRKIATVALTGDRGLWVPDDVQVVATSGPSGWLLDGHSAFVTDGDIAEVLLIVARTPDGLGTFEVDCAASGLIINRSKTFDPTIRLSRLTLTSVAAVPIEGADAAAVEATLDLARIALAGERAGACRRIFEITIDYMKTRIQFGRPIGSFQALKHIAADLLVEVESCTTAARAAAEAFDAGGADAQALLNLSAFVTADSFSHVAATAIQLHGGIAYTWEHPAHLYLRRAKADARLLGAPSLYRDRYVSVLEKAA